MQILHAKIRIGTEIQGYTVTLQSKYFVLAHNPYAHLQYVVWDLGLNCEEVSNGRYCCSLRTAVNEYIKLHEEYKVTADEQNNNV